MVGAINAPSFSDFQRFVLSCEREEALESWLPRLLVEARAMEKDQRKAILDARFGVRIALRSHMQWVFVMRRVCYALDVELHDDEGQAWGIVGAKFKQMRGVIYVCFLPVAGNERKRNRC